MSANPVAWTASNTTPMNQSEVLHWGMTDEDFVNYAITVPNETLAIVQVTTDGQLAFVENKLMIPYQQAIQYFLFRASTGRAVIHTNPQDIFGPVDISAAFTSSCSGLSPNAMFSILHDQYPTLANYSRVLILHNSSCEQIATAAGTGNVNYFYLRSKGNLPFVAGEDPGLPAISRILSGLLSTFSANGGMLGRDGAYYDNWSFPLQGPGQLLANFTISNHPYSIMGDVSLNSEIFYLSKFPSPPNLELAGWLDGDLEVAHYTQNSGPLTVQLRNYLRSRQTKVLKIDYAPGLSLPGSTWSLYAYYNRAAGKLIFDYGPFASAYGVLATSQEVATLDAKPGEWVTFSNVPLLNGQAVTVEISDVSPTLDYMNVTVHP